MKYHNKTNTCDECGNKLEYTNALREYNRKGEWSGRWLCRSCYDDNRIYGKYRHIPKKYNTSKIKKENILSISRNNPMSKEFQKDAKMLGLTGNQFIKYKKLERKYGKEFADWTIENDRKVPNNLINKGCKTYTEYFNKLAQEAGYECKAERQREWRYNTGRQLPKEINEDCSKWFGEFIAENYIMKTFEDPVPMPPNNPGFDWICKNGKKIQCMARCLTYIDSNWSGWKFGNINYNQLADYFILSLWESRNSLRPIYVFIIYKDDIVRGDPFWMRESITITNGPDCIIEFGKFQITDKLEKLKEIINEIYRNMKI